MDASRATGIRGNAKFGISSDLAHRLALANDLRDLADSLENGTRTILEFCTNEHVVVEGFCVSAVFLKTQWKQKQTEASK